MKRFLLLALLLLSCRWSVGQSGEVPARHSGQLIVVVPFENTSKAPGLDWIGESFPEVLGPRLASAQLFVISLQDRIYAFDRLGIPANTRPSRATLFRISEEMDVDYVVVGSYNFDGRTFTARAQLMDVKKMKLTPEVAESGALTQLVEVQNALAWSLLRQLDLVSNTAKNNFIAGSATTLRLDALENYVRGVMATTRPEKIKHFKDAVRLSPDYAQANFQLGKTYFDSKEYETSATWLAKVPRKDPIFNEANFYLGLASYYTGNLERAEQAFRTVARKLPLIEVYNNLGVVVARQGKKEATEYFERAAKADSRDPDYHFNLGLAFYKHGDIAAAAMQLKEAVGLHPQDAEAKSLLDMVNTGTAYNSAVVNARERIKQNYDETSYRQLALELQNVNELRHASLSRPEHAKMHVTQGNELLAQGVEDQAENEFREAILLDPMNARAHIGLARTLQSRDDLVEARGEVNAANRLEITADGFLVLCRIDLKQKKPEACADNLERALKVDPRNIEAIALKQAMEAQKANPVLQDKP